MRIPFRPQVFLLLLAVACLLAIAACVSPARDRAATTAEAPAALDFQPLELADIPVNGTELNEDVDALRAQWGFTGSVANKIVEHGDAVALMPEREGIETPHLDWASDYAGGPLRILWVVAPNANYREPIEIAQRSGFDITLLQIPTTLTIYAEDKDPKLNAFFAERFEQKLAADYDVIVIRGYSTRQWRSDKVHPLKQRVFERIDEKVRAGTGLICLQTAQQWYRANKEDLAHYQKMSPISYGNRGFGGVPTKVSLDSPVSSGISFAVWPRTAVCGSRANPGATVLAAIDGHPIIATGNYGDGRTVGFCYFTYYSATTLIPDTDTEQFPRFDDDYEAVYATFLRALTWAGRKAPTVTISAPDLVSVEAGQTPRVLVGLTAANGAAPRMTLHWQLRDDCGSTVAAGALPVDYSTPPAAASLPLPALHDAGLYRVDLRLTGQGKTWNWGTVGVRVTGGIDLAVERLDDLVEPGQPARYRVGTGGAAGRLHVLAVDGIDRVFHDQVLEVADGQEVVVDTRGSRLPYNRVYFTLLGDGPLPRARVAERLYLPRIGLDSLDEQYVIAVYGNSTTAKHLRPWAGLLYRAAGFNACYFNWHHREKMQWLAEQGLFGISGAAWGFRQRGFDKVHHQSPNVPEVREKWAKKIASDCDDFRTFGAISRVMDDETWFAYTAYEDGEMRGAQLTQDEPSLERFRAHLKDKYGQIAKLNDMWGTDFADFAAVSVIEEKDVQGQDNPSGWVEFRDYMNWTYAARYYGWVNEEHRRHLGDPTFGAGVGAPHWTNRGGDPTYRGGDAMQMRRYMPFMMLYGGGGEYYPQAAFVGQPGAQKYEQPKAWQDFGPWQHVLAGADAQWFYIGQQIIGPELAWRPHTEWMVQGSRDIVRGCGALIANAQPAPSGVKILYNSRDMALGWLFAKREDAWSALGGGMPGSFNTFRKLFAEVLFLNPEYIGVDDLTGGALDDCKLLILPMSMCMSDAQAAAIAAYVRRGGKVIADVQPASRHDMGKPRANSALAEVFGVDFGKARIHKERESWYSVGIASPEDAAVTFSREMIWLPNAVSFLDLEATTAVPHARILSKQGAETVGCFINRYGEGQAMLLNFIYGKLDSDTLGWHRLFGDDLLAWAGLESPARIVDAYNGAPLPYRPLFAYRRGKARLFGSIRGNQIWSGHRPMLVDLGRAFSLRDEARFTWTGAGHVYDVRRGKYLGHGEAATIDLPSFEGRLLAVLPYQVTAVAVEAPARVSGGAIAELIATVRTDGEAPGEHLLWVGVTSPNGIHKPLYSGTRKAPNGQASFTIPFAINDRPGAWRVTIRDVMTGVEQTLAIDLRE